MSSEGTLEDARVDIGADVVGSDGTKIGTVSYVVVRPPQLHVTDYVVTTGEFLGRDIVVPVDSVERIADGQLHLRVDKHALGELKDYIEIHYTRPPESWAPLGGFTYSTESTLLPSSTFYPEDAEVRVNAPAGTVGLSKGMPIETSDGHNAGSIGAVDEDSTTGNITGLILTEGHFFKHEVHIPASTVARVRDDRVTLTLTRDELQRQYGQ
ncbi:MAG: hypothetical protein NVSMB52_19320 [Chloroflexota bacterium]